jgi:hypothetical protein
MFTNIYFDQHGDAYAVRVGNVNNIFIGCHFLPAPACTREGLLRVTTARSQRLIVMGCNANLNGSAVQSLVWYSAKAGIPDDGVVANNMVYGTGTAWHGFALDSNSTVIGNIDNGAYHLGGNCRSGSRDGGRGLG